MPLLEALQFTVHGMLGGIIAEIVKSKTWRSLIKWYSIKAYLLGAAAGYIYYLLHVEHGFPDSLTSIVVGYTAKDFIENVVQWMSLPKPPQKKGR